MLSLFGRRFSCDYGTCSAAVPSLWADGETEQDGLFFFAGSMLLQTIYRRPPLSSKPTINAKWWTSGWSFLTYIDLHCFATAGLKSNSWPAWCSLHITDCAFHRNALPECLSFALLHGVGLWSGDWQLLLLCLQMAEQQLCLSLPRGALASGVAECFITNDHMSEVERFSELIIPSHHNTSCTYFKQS